MAFVDMVSYMDRVLLDRFSETVVLSYGNDSLTVPAVVDMLDENAEPLVSGTARQTLRLTMTAADASGVSAEWTATVRGVERQVIAAIPDGAGMVTIWLGEEV